MFLQYQSSMSSRLTLLFCRDVPIKNCGGPLSALHSIDRGLVVLYRCKTKNFQQLAWFSFMQSISFSHLQHSISHLTPRGQSTCCGYDRKICVGLNMSAL